MRHYKELRGTTQKKHTLHKVNWNPIKTNELLQFQEYKYIIMRLTLLTFQIPKPLNLATMWIEMCMCCEGRVCEDVEGRFA